MIVSTVQYLMLLLLVVQIYIPNKAEGSGVDWQSIV